MAEGGTAIDRYGYTAQHAAVYSATLRVTEKEQCAVKSCEQLVAETSEDQLGDLLADKYREQMTLDDKVRSLDQGEGQMTGEELTAENIIMKYSLQKPYIRTLCDEPTENLRYLSLPATGRFCFDLNHGFDGNVEKDFDNEYISLLLECLDKQDIKTAKGDFVSRRGCLARIGTSCYADDERFDQGLEVAVQLFQGVFYVCEFKPKKDSSLKDKMNSHIGLKFESYVTAKKGEKPQPNNPLDLVNDFRVAVKAKLNSHVLVLSGEVDCCDPDNDGQFTELKTRFIRSGRRSPPRYFTCCKWWMQSFLLGVEHIVCGVRDAGGKVINDTAIERYTLSQLETEMHPRKPQECIDSIDLFLQRVKSEVKEELVPHVFYRPAHHRMFNPAVKKDESFAFLPFWFTSKRKNSA